MDADLGIGDLYPDCGVLAEECECPVGCWCKDTWLAS